MTTYTQSFLPDFDDLAAVQETNQAAGIKDGYDEAQNLLDAYGKETDGTLIAGIQAVDLDRVSASIQGYVGGFIGREALVRELGVQVARITGIRKAVKEMSASGLISHRNLYTLEHVNQERQTMILWMLDRTLDQCHGARLEFSQQNGFH